MFILGFIGVGIVSWFFWKMIAEDKHDEEVKREYERHIDKIDKIGEDIKEYKEELRREMDELNKESDNLRREIDSQEH